MFVRHLPAGCLLIALVCLAAVGCKPQEPPAPPTPSLPPLAHGTTTSGPVEAVPTLPPGHPPLGEPTPSPANVPAGELPPGHPPIPGMATAAPAEAKPIAAPTHVEGLSLTPPADWQAVEPKATGGAMAFKPSAVFDLPCPEGKALELRVTHFPGMRNVPLEANLDRWYESFTQPDGRPTKDVAKPETFEAGGAKITVVDISGTMSSGSMGAGGGPGLPNYRMIAAVIEHPQGPHFVKVAGPAACVEKWHDSILAYLHTAKVDAGGS